MAIIDMNGYEAQTEGRVGVEAIPPGWYTAVITESAMKPTKNGEGQYLELKLEVLEGAKTGSVLFDRLNLVNQNETARKIAYQCMDEILVAQEHIRHTRKVQDSSELHGTPMLIDVSVRKSEGINPNTSKPYEASNEIKKYLACTPENKAKIQNMGVASQAGIGTTQIAGGIGAGSTGPAVANVPPVTASVPQQSLTTAPAIPAAPPWSGG